MQGSDTDSVSTAEPSPLSSGNRKAILATALIQGLALYLLKALPAAESWSPVWLYLSYTLVIAIPPLVILTIAPRLARHAWWVVTAFAALLALVAGYRGYQCTPSDTFNCGWPHELAVTAGIATFIVAFLLRASAVGRERLTRPDYPSLFHYSWDNALTAGLTLVFTAIFWMILYLWQALFKLVGIDFFHQLFGEDWFFYPVTWLVAGSGAILFRSQQSFVLTLKRLLRTMLVALLPLLAVLTIVFLATLPFTGLQPIWDTGRGSVLLLWLVALLFFFTNGVIQDEFPFQRYPLWINRVLLLALIVTPFYAAFALYGLFLRVQQYGWTPERLWGMVVALTLALLALTYSISILRRGGQWAEWLRRINTGLAFWILAICLITQSPLLNFWKISADNQASRLLEGKIELAEFDFYFLRHKLGRPGLDTLRSLEQETIIRQNPEIARYIQSLMDPGLNAFDHRQNPLREDSEAKQLRNIEVLPAGASLPENFNVRHIGRTCLRDNDCVWLRRDLDGDGEDEVLLFSLYRNRQLTTTVFYREGGRWQRLSSSGRSFDQTLEVLKRKLSDESLELRPPRWQSLYIGDELLFDPTQ